MNFLTFNRNKYGDKYPIKMNKNKNGLIINWHVSPFMFKSSKKLDGAGYEENLLVN